MLDLKAFDIFCRTSFSQQQYCWCSLNAFCRFRLSLYLQMWSCNHYIRVGIGERTRLSWMVRTGCTLLTFCPETVCAGCEARLSSGAHRRCKQNSCDHCYWRLEKFEKSMMTYNKYSLKYFNWHCENGLWVHLAYCTWYKVYKYKSV